MVIPCKNQGSWGGTQGLSILALQLPVALTSSSRKGGGGGEKKKERIKEKINAEVKQNLVRTNILTTKKIIIIKLSDKRKLDSKY